MRVAKTGTSLLITRVPEKCSASGRDFVWEAQALDAAARDK